MIESFLSHSWLIPLVPAISALFLLLSGKRIKPILSAMIATIAMGCTFVIWIGSFISLQTIDNEHLQRGFSNGYTWIEVGSFSVDLRFMIDPLSIVMVGFITFVGTLIHIYSIDYMKGDPRYSRFFAYLNLFAASMLVLVLGENLLVTFLGWEGVGLCSYLLISFWFEKDSAATAGKKAFITNRVGDVGFLLAMFLIAATPALGSLSYESLQANASSVQAGTATAIVLLLFVGAMGKSAQFPLHIWLPDAMEGPTPVSALIHAATMVTSGVFVMVRVAPLIDNASAYVGIIIASIGALTALYAAICALTQNDIKRVLAYSTISQLGYTFMAIGMGAYTAAIFHVFTHAFFKALLFLGAGSVIHAMHKIAHDKGFDEQDMRYMGGLRKFLPVTSLTFVIGWLAIAGIVPFAGFWSKDEILATTLARGGIVGPIIWGIGILTAIITAFYMTRQVWMVFFGAPRWEHETQKPHESPKTMTIPLVVLSLFSVGAGFVNIPIPSREDFLKFLEPAIAGATQTHPKLLDTTQGLLLASLALAVVIAGIIVAISIYSKRPRNTEDEPLYVLGPVYKLSKNAFFVNDFVSKIVSGVGTKFANSTSFVFDTKVVDATFTNSAKSIEKVGVIARQIQSGIVRRYITVITTSTLIFVLVVVLGVTR